MEIMKARMKEALRAGVKKHPLNTGYSTTFDPTKTINFFGEYNDAQIYFLFLEPKKMGAKKGYFMTIAETSPLFNFIKEKLSKKELKKVVFEYDPIFEMNMMSSFFVTAETVRKVHIPAITTKLSTMNNFDEYEVDGAKFFKIDNISSVLREGHPIFTR